MVARRLGELEGEIMRRLWHRGVPMTTRELVDELSADQRIAYTTVMTICDILYKKGWLRRDLDGRAYRYQPVSTGQEYSAGLMRQALDASPDRAGAFAQFLGQLSAEEVRDLEAAYVSLTGKQPGRGD